MAGLQLFVPQYPFALRGALVRQKKQTDSIASPRLSEDWISVIVGLAIVLVVALFSLSSIPWPLFGVFS
jgi:uncharacterized membrane protein YcfT